MFSLMLMWGVMIVDTSASMDSLKYPRYEMEEIVVTATRTPRLWKEISLPITVITEEEIKGMNLKDVGDIIGYRLSAKVEKYGGMGAASSILMRGLYSAQTMVLIDGRPINSPSLGGADLSWISGVGIERIEIVRGPISSLYGTNALAGVVNIITHSEPKNSVSLSYGSWNTILSSIESGRSFGNLTYLVTGAYRKSGGERNNSAHNSKELSGKANYRLGVGDFNLHTGFYQGETGMPGVKPSSDTTKRDLSQKRLGNDEVSSLYDKGRDNRFFFTTGLNFRNLKLSGFVNNWDDDVHMEWVLLNRNTFQEEYHIIDNNFKTKTGGIEIQDTRNLWHTLFTYGASFTLNQFDVHSTDFNRSTDSINITKWDAGRETKALYLQDEIEISKVRITLGIRWDSTSYDTSGFAQISPKTSIAWKFSEGSKLMASYGKGFRTPTLNDLYWPADPYSEGNPNLKPEKGESYEIGIENMFWSKILSRVSLFKQDICNMIQWAPVGTGNKWIPANVNRVKTTGAEVEIKIGLLKGLELRTDYTYLDAWQTNKELVDYMTNQMEVRTRRATYIPTHKIDMGIEYRVAGVRLNIDAQYVGKTYNYYPKYAAYPNSTVTMETKLNPDYTLVRAKLNKKFKMLNFFVAADNLLDEKYAKFGSNMNDRGYPMPGRSFTLGVGVDF